MDESVADAQQAIAASSTSATIFITTATDVLGFFVFLGLARAVL